MKAPSSLPCAAAVPPPAATATHRTEAKSRIAIDFSLVRRPRARDPLPRGPPTTPPSIPFIAADSPPAPQRPACDETDHERHHDARARAAMAALRADEPAPAALLLRRR